MVFSVNLSGLLLLLSVCLLCADETNFTVFVGGKLRTESDLEQIVKAHAIKTGMQFSFDGARRLCTVDTNARVVVSLFFAQTNGTYLYAQVRRDGRVFANELTPRDSEAIRPIVAKETTEEILGIFMDSIGRVTAKTLTHREGVRAEGKTFFLKHTSRGWVIDGRGSWSATKDLPPRLKVE